MDRAVTTAWLPARAKLNLVLRIVGRRADGYHLLETLFHPLQLHDDLTLERRERGTSELVVTADTPQLQVPPGPDNLVLRALQRFAAATGSSAGFRARLHKRIPAGGGLGGGSSDAAAALRLANALLGAPLAPTALAAVASQLGADVPFFLAGGSQWGFGIGDELHAAAVPAQQFVLLLPPFACPTAEVYKSYAALWHHGPPSGSVPSLTVPQTGNTPARIAFHNDLEHAAERVRPELAGLRAAVVAAGHGDVRMTGSGSTLFLARGDAAAAAATLASLAHLRSSGVALLVSGSGPPELDAIRAGAAPPPAGTR